MLKTGPHHRQRNYDLLKGDQHPVCNNVTSWQFERVHLLGRTTISQYKTSFDQSWHGWPGSVVWTWIWFWEWCVTMRLCQHLQLWLCQVSCRNISEVWSVKKIQGPYCTWQLYLSLPPATMVEHMWVVGWVGYINLINKPKGNGNQ